MLYCVGVCVGVRERERQSFFLHFIYFWLGWVFVAACSFLRLGLVAVLWLGLVAVLPLGLVVVLRLGLVAVLPLGLVAVLRLVLVAVLGLLITVASLAVERARQPRCVSVRGLDACSL